MSQNPVLGEIDFKGYHLRENVLSLLADPIREWFLDHPDENDPSNTYFAHIERDAGGRYHCILNVVGRHHWSATGTGRTLRTALRDSLNDLAPDLELTQTHTDES